MIKGKTIDYNYLSNDILEHPYVIMGLGTALTSKRVKKLRGGWSGGIPLPNQANHTESSPSLCGSDGLAVFNDQMTFDPNPITAYASTMQ